MFYIKFFFTKNASSAEVTHYLNINVLLLVSLNLNWKEPMFSINKKFEIGDFPSFQQLWSHKHKCIISSHMLQSAEFKAKTIKRAVVGRMPSPPDISIYININIVSGMKKASLPANDLKKYYSIRRSSFMSKWLDRVVGNQSLEHIHVPYLDD